jgi:tricorn protease
MSHPPPFLRLLTAVALFFVTCATSQAQLAPPAMKPVVFPRMPALSPDGKTLAFVYRGDVWVSPATGGRAYPVTDHVDLDAYPVFSPDGQWIAFSSVRNGNWDIFVVPTAGGTPRQITFSSAGEIATDWSPDGKSLLYSTSYDVPHSTIFKVDVNTLRFTKLTEDMDALAYAQYSRDGHRLVFQRSGFPWTRPRYHGSAAAQVWTLDLADGKRHVIRDDEQQNLWPHFLPDGSVVAVTVGEPTPNAQWLNKPLPRLVDNDRRTPNLWHFPADGGRPQQMTSFVGGSVRFPAVARETGDIVFEQEHDLYRLPAGAKTPVKLALYCGAEDKQNDIARQTLTTGATEAEISPDGKTFAFGLQNEIWTVPVEKPKTRDPDDATRLTDYPGYDGDFNWSLDNKTLFFVSDRAFSNRIYAMDVATKALRTLWDGPEDANSPQVSPDGKWVGFWVHGPVGSRGGLYVRPAGADQAGVAPKRIVALPSDIQGDFAWSPDMKWIAYSRRNVESDGINIWITPADGSGQPVDVTQLNAYHGMPRWTPDGKYLLFASDRDGGGLYALPLQPETARADDLTVAFVKPKAPVAVGINFQDPPERIRRLTTQNPDADLTITADGVIYFLSGGDAWSCSYDGKTTTKLTNGGGVQSLRVSTDGKTLYFLRGGGLNTMSVGGGNPITAVPFSAVYEHDVRAERQAAFTQFWHAYETRFYDGNFHGRDWAAIRDRYQPMLDGIATPDEFANLLNMMVGELEASHSEISRSTRPNPGPTTSNLGVYFDYSYVGPGIKVLDVPRLAPGSYDKTRIKPGEYIVAVDGKDVTLDENLFKVLNDKGDHDFTLLVNTTPTRTGAREVKYKALTGGEWGDIDYRDRVERLRKATEARSKGKIAYINIQGMGQENQILFDRQLYQYAEGKAAVIIDVRFNGGGNISDTLISWLDTKPYAIYYPRDGYPDLSPSRTWHKPVIVLMDDHSFSNAEMFPYGMRAAGVAKLVGTATPGYVIWTGGLELVDGTHARMPGSGVYRADGSPMEDMGEQPDVSVPMTNEDFLSDRDPQLDKAVDMLLHK